MRPIVWALLVTPIASAHVVSMSNGDLTIEGALARYELRIPMYEVAHVAAPERTLLEHVKFTGAALLTKTCAPEVATDTYICRAEYRFASPVEQLEVECTLASITVPNHVHLLRARMGDKRDQGIFDLSFTRATLRFRPPTRFETAMEEGGAGFFRALGGPVQILFLAALALASRTRREWLAVFAMFLAGQAIAVAGVPRTTWQPAPRFVEAAAALAVAYLAVEILLLPKAGSRWLVAGILGVFHGLYFHLFLQSTGFHTFPVMFGAALAEALAFAALVFLFSRISRITRISSFEKVPASALLLFGLAWFVLRLRS
jgi:hypothetical protein